MTSKRPRPIILVVGILLVVAAFAGVTLLGGMRSGGSAPAVKVSIVGAAHDIKTGQAILGADVTLIDVDYPPTGASKTAVQVVGKISRTDIKAGAPITDSMLAATAPASAAKLYFSLPAGDVAMNIPASEITPYVQPGDEIDVMAAPHPVAGAAAGTTKTKIALKSVRVLSVGIPNTPNAGNLVVAVTPPDAEALQFLIKNTDFTYVLRSPLDVHKPDAATGGVDIATFKQQYGY